MRVAALLAILAASACGGPSAATSQSPEQSPEPARGPPLRPAPDPRALPPHRDCAGPMAWKCGPMSRGTPSPIERRVATPEPERKTPDAVEAGPLVYRVVIDNDRVRVLSVNCAKGRAVPLHTHPDRVVYDPATGAARFEKGMHEIDDAAPRTARELVVELGSQPGAAVPAGDEPVATYPRLFKLLIDEKRVRVLAVTFGKGTSRPVALGDHVLLARDKGTLVVTPRGASARRLELEPDEVVYVPAGVYTATNSKKESFEVVLVELKP